MRNPRALALSLAALLALVAMPAVALALPGDPPIAPLGPANGSAVSAGEEGVQITFKCPAYHEQEPGFLGDSGSYRVRFSTGPALGPEGLLPTTTLGQGIPTTEADKTTCGVKFETPRPAGPTALYAGTVYWQVARPVKRTAAPAPPATETPAEKQAREDREFDEEDAAFDELEKEAETGVFKEPKGEWEGGPVWSFHTEPKVEGPRLETQRLISAGYLTPINFTSETELKGGTIELQRFAKGAWKPLSQQTATELGATFFVKLPAGRQALRAVAKSSTVSLPFKPRKVTVHKLGKHRLTSAEEDGRYKQKRGKKSKEAKEETPKLPLSFAVVDGGTRVVHLRATVEGSCAPTTRNGEEVPLKIKTALRSARIAPDGTVIADRRTKGQEPQQVTFVGQLLDGSLIGTVSTSFGNCIGSRKFEAVPIPKR